MLRTAIMMTILIGTTPIFAQNSHMHETIPKETGQSAFAAIAEITEQLRADQNTDWSNVNIAALQAHLVDMNNLTLSSKASIQEDEEHIAFIVTGEGDVIDSIKKMVKAHAPMLKNETGWEVFVEDIENGSKLTIISSEEERPMVRALGFYGLMTLGAHHQIHHKMIAMGHDPH